jgi:hypothetical protein
MTSEPGQDHNNHHKGKRKILVWSSHEAIYGPSKKANERNTSSHYDGYRKLYVSSLLL